GFRPDWQRIGLVRLLRLDAGKHRQERGRASAGPLKPKERFAMDHVLAIDQGTSATKCVLVDRGGRIVAKASAPLGERYLQAGWVEQDAEGNWLSVRSTLTQCLAQRQGSRVVAVRRATQSEFALIWRT